MSFNCPECGGELPKTPTYQHSTRMTRFDRYWCDDCFKFQRAVVPRQFDVEDAEIEYMTPALWDLDGEAEEFARAA